MLNNIEHIVIGFPPIEQDECRVLVGEFEQECGKTGVIIKTSELVAVEDFLHKLEVQEVVART